MIRTSASGVGFFVFSTVLILFCYDLEATTIVPFRNLGILAVEVPIVLVAEAMEEFKYVEGDQIFYRNRLVVKEIIKGDLTVGQDILTQKWAMHNGEFHRMMFGDLSFEQGETYLMFLTPQENGLYHPICFSYYLFKEVQLDQVRIWQPTPDEKEFQLTTQRNIEPLYYYDRDALINHLTNVSRGVESWDASKVKSSRSVVERLENHKRQSPAHCSFLASGSTGFRWLDFPEQPLAVHYASGGDPECGSSITHVQQALAVISQTYEGVTLLDGGPYSGYTPTCGSGVQGSNFTSFVQSKWGSSRHVLVQFNDPCNAIPDLSNCAGTLAVGGLYGVGSHLYDGENWFTGAYGYVVVNNGVGQCMCSANSYGSMLTHELTHTLGLGHISSSSGAANMNPVCCNDISSLDLACVNYTYESSAVLPVELVAFEAEDEDVYNRIWWETASEINVAFFTVERAADNQFRSFEPIAHIQPQQGEPTSNRVYLQEDRLPLEKSCYRLKVTDFDGSEQYSSLVIVERPDKSQTRVYPTLTKDRFFVLLSGKFEQNAVLTLRGFDGKIVLSSSINQLTSEHNIQYLPAGIYFLTLTQGTQVETWKMTKS